MNEFSRLLSSIVSKKSISISQMAAFCRIDRSSMYKIVHGSRKPSSEELVSQIALYLKLSPEETAILMEKYRILQIGPEKYVHRKAVYSFLKSCFDYAPAFSPLSLPDDAGSDLSPDRQTRVLYGETNLMNAFGMIIQEEMSRPDGLLNIRMQPRKPFIDLIRTIVGDGTGEGSLRIRHVFALDGNDVMGDSVLHNLDLLSSLMPACKSIPDYELYYYYTNLHNGLVAFYFLPYAVISGSCVLQFSVDLQFAVLHREPETIAFFNRIFDGIITGSIPLLSKVRDYRDLIYYTNQSRAGQSPVSFQMFPCLNYTLTEEILQRYVDKVLDQRSFVIRAVLEQGRKDLDSIAGSPSVIITSEQGILRFMESGRLPEYPSDMYDPIRPADRLEILRKYEEIIHKYKVSFYMVKETFGNTASETGIWVEDKKASIMLQDQRGSIRLMTIQDPGILALLFDFFHNPPDILFHNTETSLGYLHRIIEDYSRIISQEP